MEEQEKLYNQELPTLNEKRLRKSGYPGLRTTRQFTFRLDESNRLYLDSMPNKGRYINDLINLDRKYDIMIMAKRHNFKNLCRL